MGGPTSCRSAFEPMTHYLKGLFARQRLALCIGALLWLGAVAAGIATVPLEQKSQSGLVPASPSWALRWSILSNNAIIALLAFAGILTFGIITVLYALASGLLFGHFLAQAVNLAGLLGVIRGVGPHGIVEFPAIIIAISAGLSPLAYFLRTALGGRKEPRENLFQAAQGVILDAASLLCISLLMIVIAATIETWVTLL